MARWLLAMVLAAAVVSTLAAGDGSELPRCQGGAAAEQSAPAGAEPARCQAAPSQVDQSRVLQRPFSPIPTPGYHHIGQIATASLEASQGRLQVTDPQTRLGSTDFIASRLLMCTLASCSHWIEVGWVEAGWWGDRRLVYVFDTADDGQQGWKIYEQYPLGGVASITVQLRYDSSSGTWQALLSWNGTWNLLRAASLPSGGSPGTSSHTEAIIEPYTPDGMHPRLPPTEQSALQVDPAGANGWQLWGPGVSTSRITRNGPYEAVWRSLYDDWLGQSRCKGCR